MKKKRILLLEETESVSKLLIFSFQKLTDYVENIYVKKNPVDIVDMIQNNKIDLIFADIEFEKFHDFYAAEQLKNNEIRIPYYLISCSPLNQNIEQIAYHLKAKGIVQPLKNIKLLFEAVKKIVTGEVEEEFFVLGKNDESIMNLESEAKALKDEIGSSYEDIDTQLMELNGMIISLLKDLNTEKQKTQFWENTLKQYSEKFGKKDQPENSQEQAEEGFNFTSSIQLELVV